MEEETSELRTEWERHPYTAKWAKYFRNKDEQAFKQLMATCSVSSDATVRAAHAQYVSVHENAALFAIGGDKK